MEVKQHIDGNWITTKYEYSGRKILIKSREGHGMKAHVFLGDKVDFTLRYSFVNPKELLQKAHNKIDRNNKLFEAWQYCDDNDKSTEFMLEYMQCAVKGNLDEIVRFIEKKGKLRVLWNVNQKK